MIDRNRYEFIFIKFFIIIMIDRTSQRNTANQHIILIHGMWSSSDSMRPVADHLSAKGYQVHCRDLPHRHRVAEGAESAQPLAGLSIRSYVDNVCGYIDSLELEQPPILLGHSMGGLIAQLVATRRETSGLVLLASAPPAGIHTIRPIPVWNSLCIMGRPRFWNKPSQLFPSAAKRGLFNCVEENRRAELMDNMMFDSGRIYGEIVFWFLDPHRTTHIPDRSIEVPVLVVGAGRDGLLPVAVAKKIAAKYPQADYLQYDNHGHWLIDERGTSALLEDITVWIADSVVHSRRSTAEPATGQDEGVGSWEDHRIASRTTERLLAR